MKRIVCEMCGSSDIVRKGKLVVCNTCGSKFADAGWEYEAVKTSENPNLKASKILEFKISETQARATFNEWLVSGDFTPQDISNVSTVQKARRVFVPTWFLSGSYMGDWTASSGYDRRETYTHYTKVHGTYKNGKSYTKSVPETRTRTVTDWKPSNGTIHGQFTTLKFANSNVDAQLGRIVADKTQWRSSDLIDFEKFDMSEYEVLPYQLDKDEAYAQYKPELEVKVRNDITVPGDRYRDLRYNYQSNYTSTKIYYPIYLYEYTYNNESHIAIIDARDINNIFGTRPKDNKLISKSKLFFLPTQIFTVLAFASTCISIGVANDNDFPLAVLFNAIISLTLISATYGMGRGLIKHQIKKSSITRLGGAVVDTTRYNDLDSDTAKIREGILLQGKVFFIIALIYVVLISGGYGIYYWYTTSSSETATTYNTSTYSNDYQAPVNTPDSVSTSKTVPDIEDERKDDVTEKTISSGIEIDKASFSNGSNGVFVREMSFSPETGKIKIQLENTTTKGKSCDIYIKCLSATDKESYEGESIILSLCDIDANTKKYFETTPEKAGYQSMHGVPKDTVKIKLEHLIVIDKYEPKEYY